MKEIRGMTMADGDLLSNGQPVAFEVFETERSRTSIGNLSIRFPIYCQIVL